MPADKPQLDDLFHVVTQLSVLREHRHELAPFRGYVGGRPDPDRDAFDKIERHLLRQARRLAYDIAGSLN